MSRDDPLRLVGRVPQMSSPRRLRHCRQNRYRRCEPIALHRRCAIDDRSRIAHHLMRSREQGEQFPYDRVARSQAGQAALEVFQCLAPVAPFEGDRARSSSPFAPRKDFCVPFCGFAALREVLKARKLARPRVTPPTPRRRLSSTRNRTGRNTI
jgi:hypothetical protein